MTTIRYNNLPGLAASLDGLRGWNIELTFQYQGATVKRTGSLIQDQRIFGESEVWFQLLDGEHVVLPLTDIHNINVL